MRVATIDIGTNSVLLLVAERERDGAIRPIVERATITRLGQGVDRTGELHPDAIQRTLACLREYAAIATSEGAGEIVAVGTSAVRDARGGDEFAREAASILGRAPRIIRGEEEAQLTFEGAIAGLGARGDVAVMDVGGGSTEIVAGTWDGSTSAIASAVSVNVGSVRLTERHVKSDPPARYELDAIAIDVDRALDCVERIRPSATFVGVAGTVTTIAAVARKIAPYDGARVHGLVLSRDEIRATRAMLAKLPLAERKNVEGIEPKRADVIVAGAIIVERVMDHAGATELVVSDRGVRWGLAIEAFRAR